MRTPVRVALLLLPALFVAMTLVHVTHAHPTDEASSFHPTCTICQFSAPVAEQGGVQSHEADPGPGSYLVARCAPIAPTAAPACIHASRAPPAFLAA